MWKKKIVSWVAQAADPRLGHVIPIRKKINGQKATNKRSREQKRAWAVGG